MKNADKRHFLLLLQNIFALNYLENQFFFVSLPSVLGEIGTNESIRYYFALSQKCVGNINWNKTPLK